LSTSLETLLLELGRRMSGNREPETRSGRVTASGGLTTVYDAQRRWETDNYWDDGYAIFTAQTSNSGNLWPASDTMLETEVRISTYTISGGTTLARSMAEAVASGDSYQFHRMFAPTQKREALNQALQSVYPELAYRVVDESLEIKANTWAYSVPSRIHEIHDISVEMQRGIDTYPFYELPRESWTVENDVSGGKHIRRVRFTMGIHNLAAVGNNIRLTGGGPHADLTLLADTVPIAGAQLDPLYWETIKRLWSEHSQSIYEVSDEVVTAYKVAEKQASESLKKVGFRRGKVRRSVQRVRFS
jgi:hypothetical protein